MQGPENGFQITGLANIFDQTASSNSSASSTSTSTSSPLPSSASTGGSSLTQTDAIVGGVIGGVATLIIILGVVWWQFRKRKTHHKSIALSNNAEKPMLSSDDDDDSGYCGVPPRDDSRHYGFLPQYEMDADRARQEMAVSEPKHELSGVLLHELSDDNARYELPSEMRYELRGETESLREPHWLLQKNLISNGPPKLRLELPNHDLWIQQWKKDISMKEFLTNPSG